MTPPDPVAQARQLVAEQAPAALVAVLGGSAAAGRATGTSDLDIAVLVPDGAETRRETLRFRGRPVELFVHTRAGLAELFAADAASRRGTMQHLYAEAVVLVDTGAAAAALLARARAAVAEGPVPLSREAVETRRYSLTDALDDLTDAGDRFEQLALGSVVLGIAADLLLDRRRAWTGGGKWFPRRLLAADPERGAHLLDAHRHLCETADQAPLVDAAARVLDLLGGPLAEGYRRSWPGLTEQAADARRAG
jgi:Nucleotidyltransferase domain